MITQFAGWYIRMSDNTGTYTTTSDKMTVYEFYVKIRSPCLFRNDITFAALEK